jgi:hypothetical protein
MSSLSDYLENKILDHLFRGQAYVPPGTFYFALYTSAPTEAGGGTEVSGGGYARAAYTRSLASFAGTQAAGSTSASNGTGGQTSNSSPVSFPAPTGTWGLVTHWGIFDSVTGGNLLIQGVLTTPKTVNGGDAAPVFPATAFTMTLA